MAFLLTVMPALPSASSASEPRMPFSNTSTSIRWLSVPPDTTRKPASCRAAASALALQEAGFRVVSGGTDNHLMLVDVFEKGILGSEAELALGKAGITVNKNAIPYDTNPPLKPSGIRIGTPALTTRGMREPEMRQIAAWIRKALENRTND